jgi:hypothetical protein
MCEMNAPIRHRDLTFSHSPEITAALRRYDTASTEAERLRALAEIARLRAAFAAGVRAGRLSV